jgi:flagellin-like hook-associated protein FlgL
VYVAEMESFAIVLQRQFNLTDTIISSKESTISAIININEVEELSALTMLQVRQEATISMLAQANIIQGYAAQLYGGPV